MYKAITKVLGMNEYLSAKAKNRATFNFSNVVVHKLGTPKYLEGGREYNICYKKHALVLLHRVLI